MGSNAKFLPHDEFFDINWRPVFWLAYPGAMISFVSWLLT